MLEPRATDENVGKYGHNVRIIRIERERAIKMDFSFIIPSKQEQQLCIDSMGPCIAIVNVEGCFYMSECLTNRSFIGHFDEYTADMGPRYIGVGTGIVRINRDGSTKKVQCFGKIDSRQTPPSIIPQ